MRLRVEPRPQTRELHSTEVKVGIKSQRVLDFDCECRPTAWYGQDWVTKQITAIAWKFIGERSAVQCALMTVGDSEDELGIIQQFLEAYDEADMVSGHFISGFDLPLISGSLLRLGQPPLKQKMTQDTKRDLIKSGGLSKSQENLGAMFELTHPKVHMSQADWRLANTLDPGGIELARKRVVGDVKEHIELRERLLELGALRPPKLWTPQAEGTTRYAP